MTKFRELGRTILKIRVGKSTRFVEVAKRAAGGGYAGWRLDSDGLRWATEKKQADGTIVETRELIMFGAKDIICEMVEDRHYGGLRRVENHRSPT